MKRASTTPTTSEATAPSTIDSTMAVVPEVKSHGSRGMKAPMAKVTKEAAAACHGEPRLWVEIPSSSRACVSSASSGSCITSLTISLATPGSIPRFTYMPRSSAASPSGLCRSARRSTSSSRSISSRWAVMETYSPAAMEKEPAMSPATPARRTIEPPGLAPAMPRTSETLVTRPSLTPKTAARAPPPLRSRWWCRGAAVVLVRGAHRRQRSEVSPRG